MVNLYQKELIVVTFMSRFWYITSSSTFINIRSAYIYPPPFEAAPTTCKNSYSYYLWFKQVEEVRLLRAFKCVTVPVMYSCFHFIWHFGHQHPSVSNYLWHISSIMDSVYCICILLWFGTSKGCRYLSELPSSSETIPNRNIWLTIGYF